MFEDRQHPYSQPDMGPSQSDVGPNQPRVGPSQPVSGQSQPEVESNVVVRMHPPKSINNTTKI